ILRHRCEQRHADAEPDRAGREVDGFAVLGARRVGLRAAEGAKPLQFFAALMPEQILDRVEDRRGVRLDRDTVLWTQHVEIERGHQGRQRGTRRLVAAHLQPIPVRAKVVGVVDHPGRQPQHLALERRQAGDLVLRRLFFLYADRAFQDLRHFHLLLPGGSLADSRLKFWHLTDVAPVLTYGPKAGSGSIDSMAEAASETEERRIVLTESAARRIATLKIKEDAESAFLRIAVSGGGCSGLQYGLSFDDQRNEDGL